MLDDGETRDDEFFKSSNFGRQPLLSLFGSCSFSRETIKRTVIMGNICCGSKGESPKDRAFTTAGGGDSSEIDGNNNNKWDAGSAGGDSSGALSGAGGTTIGSSTVANSSNYAMSMMDQQQQLLQQQQQAQAAMMDAGSTNKENAAAASHNNAAALLLREEQARLEMIVSTAGRAMVAVRSTRGSNAYYDQGFAAALGQHLEQTTTFPKKLPRQLPPFASSSSSNIATTTTAIGSSSSATASALGDAAKAASSSSTTTASADSNISANKMLTGDSSSVYARLNQPAWEFIQLGTKKHGLAGCAGENPHAYFDHVAESFLDEIVPHKKRLFAKVQPIVESLL
jgi:hypothetical protein